MTRPSFDFFEVVRVEPRRGSDPELKALSLEPEDLASTGEFRQREDYYDGTSIRVSVKGQILE